jgi:hypothetical protein
LMAIKAGVAPEPTPARDRLSPSPSRSSQRPQLKLPLGGVASRQQASAPTMMSDQVGTACPRCGRTIPIDSNFCSFCAADVTGRLRPIDRSEPEAQTIILDDVAEPMRFPGPIFHGHRRRRRSARRMLLVVAGMFALGYIAFRSSVPEPTRGDDASPPLSSAPDAPGYGGTAPDASEPAHTDPREIELRQALNSLGYRSVHFRMEGDTILLWGTVPTEADRMMVQTQVFLVARIFSLEDHIQVRDTFAEP